MTCENCVHYRQHYIINGVRVSVVSCGSCGIRRLKEYNEKACKFFAEKNAEEEKEKCIRSIYTYIADAIERLTQIEIVLHSLEKS